MSEHSLEQALAMARRSLEVLETQAAGYSVLTIPAHLFLELEEKRKEIARLEAQVRAAAGTPGAGLPHNLPRRGEFVGRAVYKARVHEALRSRSYLVSIEGIGGIGKTSLALEVAYECLQPGESTAHFDGAIWASARDRSLNLDDVLDAVARTLDYPGIAQKPLEEKREGVVRLLRSGAYLLLVDNFETITDPAVGEFLQDLPEPSKALVTTRERKLERAWTIPLKGLEEAEALALIRAEGRRIGMPALEQAADAVLLPLYTATGGAPLALKWAVGQIKQPGQSLDTVLMALHEAQGNLFDQMFSRSWKMLTSEARQVLMVMPLFATSATQEAIESASDIHHYRLDEALRQLVEMSLVAMIDALEPPQRRYSVHPLTRAFSESILKKHPDIQSCASHRLALFFKEFVEHCAGNRWVLQGFAELDSELFNILSVLEWCWNHDENLVAAFLLDGIDYYLIVRNYWNEALRLGQRAIDIANRIGDKESAALFKMQPVSFIMRYRGDLVSAESLLVDAIGVFESVGNESRLMHAKRNLGRVYLEDGNFDCAEGLFCECFTYAEMLGDWDFILLLTYNMAWAVLGKEDLDKAWELCVGVLDIARQLDAAGQFVAGHLSGLYNALGEVALRRSDLQIASYYGMQALEQARRIGRLDVIANNLKWLAHVEMRQGDFGVAQQRLVEAKEHYQRLDIPSRVEEIGTLLAQLDREHPTHA